MTRIVIDVRQPDEYAAGYVEGAINIPLAMINEKTLSNVPKDSEIIVYCRSGARSNTAVGKLLELGYTKVTNGINQENIEKIINTA